MSRQNQRRSRVRMTGASAGMLVALFVLLPVLASAQSLQPYQLAINQINGRSWPAVTLNVTLLGPDGKAQPDIKASQFEVTEDGTPQQVTGAAAGSARSVPLNVVLAIDVSGSMAGDKLFQAKAAATAFVNSLQPDDRASVLAFNDHLVTVVSPTSDHAALIAGLNSLQSGGNTAAYDAVYQATTTLSKSPAGQRRVLVLLTDGADTSSKYSDRVAADVARQADVLVYTIGLGPDAVDSVLDALATPSGGKYYKAPGPADLQGIYQAISLELSAQLFVHYQSTTRIDRSYKLIAVSVKFTSKDGQVLVRTAHYRPSSAALLPSTPEAALSIPTPLVVALPPGIRAPGAITSGADKAPSPAMHFGLVGAGLAGVAVMLVMTGLAVLASPTPTSQRVAQFVGVGPGAIETRPVERAPGFFERALQPLLLSLGGRLTRLTPQSYVDHVKNLLVLKGPPYRPQAPVILSIQLTLALVVGALLTYWAVLTSPDVPLRWGLSAALGLIAGFYIPYYWLARSVGRRRNALLRALPGALDFLAINVEAGMGFDAALAEVVKRWRNPLTDEFAMLLIDFQIGKPRRDAWKDLIQRTQLPDLTSFVTAMLQNEQVGGSIGHLLRTQAEHMRVRRRQRAEESARVAPVKMLIPMVFFIFPGILVVILGPAIPQFIDTFSQMAK